MTSFRLTFDASTPVARVLASSVRVVVVAATAPCTVLSLACQPVGMQPADAMWIGIAVSWALAVCWPVRRSARTRTRRTV